MQTNLLNIFLIFIKNPNVFIGKKKYIFVISHMRSFSSLLCHILGSTDEISGYSEMHRSYNRWSDFLKLRYRVCLANNNQLNGQFVLDKILHNSCYISREVLYKKNIQSIIMLRNPEDTIKSIINMGKLSRIKWYKNVKDVLDYYKNRLNQIEIYGTITGKKSLFFNSEELLNNTEFVLSALKHYLKLKQQISSQYSLFEYTGIPGHGDSSSLIKKGTIINVNNKEKNNIYIDPKIIKEANQHYQHCKDVLLNYCKNI